MSKQYDWFDISKQERKEWDILCPANEYRIVTPDQLPKIIPKSLTEKYDSVVILCSGSAEGLAYYMANGNRVDFNDGAIDQMPFGLAFVGDFPIPSGSLIQHGDWAARTTHPPAEFWQHISASGIGNCYPLSELPPNPSGSIQDLQVKSQQAAFDDLVSKLKQFVPDSNEDAESAPNL